VSNKLERDMPQKGKSMIILRGMLERLKGNGSLCATQIMQLIEEALDNSEPVVIFEPDESRSKLRRDGNGGYKITPIASL
jgi:hypothetical protein